MGALEDRISALLAAYGLSGTAAGAIASILGSIESAEIAVTSVRDPIAAVDVHVADSLTALRLPAVRGAGVVADLGSGGGFPGLVLAAALPQADVRLVESVGKKCDFLAATAGAAGLENVTVVRARAEEWPEGVGAHDLVTARAVAPLPVLVEYAAPLLLLGGALVAWKGEPGAAEVADGAAAASQLGMEPRETVQIKPSPTADRRSLYVYSKVADTPPGYPRRPGMARKRPLKASTSP